MLLFKNERLNGENITNILTKWENTTKFRYSSNAKLKFILHFD
jgi:hypothetical protein